MSIIAVWRTGQTQVFKVAGAILFTAGFQPPFIQPSPPPNPVIRNSALSSYPPAFALQVPQPPAGVPNYALLLPPPEKFIPPRVVFLEQPPAFTPIVPPPPATVPNSAFLYAPPERFFPPTVARIEQPPSIALTPDTLPAKISGMAWFEPPDCFQPTHIRWVECPPAFSFSKYHLLLGARITILKGDILVNAALSGDPQ